MSDSSNQENQSSTRVSLNGALALTLLPISAPSAVSTLTSSASSGTVKARQSDNDNDKEESDHGVSIVPLGSVSGTPSFTSKTSDETHTSISLQPITLMPNLTNFSPTLVSSGAWPSGLTLPTVKGTGLAAADFESLSSVNSATALFQALSKQDLAHIASTISQVQLTQLAQKFGADADFQTLLSTGHLPAALQPLVAMTLPSVTSSTPSALATSKFPPPLVKGQGLANANFSALLGAKSSGEFFTQIASQGLDQTVSQISQDQVNQIFNKFAADPLFQNFISSGLIPKTLMADGVTPLQSTLSDSAPLSIDIVGTPIH